MNWLKRTDGNIKGVVLSKTELFNGAWREIKSDRRIEKGFSDTHVFRRFKWRLTRDVTLIIADSRACGLDLLTQSVSQEYAMIRLVGRRRCVYPSGREWFDDVEIKCTFHKNLKGQPSFIPDADIKKLFIKLSTRISKADLKKIRVSK